MGTSSVGNMVNDHGIPIRPAAKPGHARRSGGSAFGIIQLTDIAVQALSPGVNDPSTATEPLDDMLAALG